MKSLTGGTARYGASSSRPSIVMGFGMRVTVTMTRPSASCVNIHEGNADAGPLVVRVPDCANAGAAASSGRTQASSPRRHVGIWGVRFVCTRAKLRV
jgi:hypothetical protein